jgi:hypothetical protein
VRWKSVDEEKPGTEHEPIELSSLTMNLLLREKRDGGWRESTGGMSFLLVSPQQRRFFFGKRFLIEMSSTLPQKNRFVKRRQHSPRAIASK